MSETRYADLVPAYRTYCPWCAQAITTLLSPTQLRTRNGLWCEGCVSWLAVVEWRQSGAYLSVELRRESDGGQLACMRGAGEIG